MIGVHFTGEHATRRVVSLRALDSETRAVTAELIAVTVPILVAFCASRNAVARFFETDLEAHRAVIAVALAGAAVSLVSVYRGNLPAVGAAGTTRASSGLASPPPRSPAVFDPASKNGTGIASSLTNTNSACAGVRMKPYRHRECRQTLFAKAGQAWTSLDKTNFRDRMRVAEHSTLGAGRWFSLKNNG